MLTGFIIGISMGSSLDLVFVLGNYTRRQQFLYTETFKYTVSMNGYEKILPVPVSV